MKPRTLIVWTVLSLAICLLLAGTASAQEPAVNPATVLFDPSADHNTLVLGTTTPMLTRYELRLYLEGAALPFQVQDLGKPTPGQDGKISATNRAWFVGSGNNVRCVARVAAIGPGGEGVSGASGPFGNLGPPAPSGLPVIR